MAEDNAEAFEALQQAAERLRGLARTPERAAELAAPLLRDAITRQIAEGVDPEGKPWPKTRDGRTPLRNAAAHLDVKASGTVVIARLTGPDALHNYGWAAGGIQRQILPSRRLPHRLVEACTEACEEAVREALEGG